MNPISLAGPATNSTTPTAATTGPGGATTSGGGDLLAAMNPAMDAAFAIGRPMDAGGAAGILATTGSYISGAQATIAKVEDGIERRREQLAQLRASDPDAAAKLEGEIDLLERLRDRIQLSIERVSESLHGSDEDEQARADDEHARRRRDELELLEQRRQLLAQQGSVHVAPIAASQVAGTYGAARASTAGGSAA